MCATVDGG